MNTEAFCPDCKDYPLPYGGEGVALRPLSLERLHKTVAEIPDGPGSLHVSHFSFLSDEGEEGGVLTPADSAIANGLKEWLREEVLPAIFTFGKYVLPVTERDADSIGRLYRRKLMDIAEEKQREARREERVFRLRLMLLYLRSLSYCSQRELLWALPFSCTHGTISKWKKKAIRQGLITANEWEECFAMARRFKAHKPQKEEVMGQ